MPTAVVGPRLGDDARLYYSATLGGAGVLTAIDCVIDDEIASEKRTADSNVRGDNEIRTLIGKPRHSLSGNFQTRVGTAGVQYLVMKAAYIAGTVLHFAATTGDILDSGQQVFRSEMQISKWTESRPDGDSIKVAFELVPSALSTYASNFAVVP